MEQVVCTVPGLDYHHISQWHLRKFCNLDSDPDREEEAAVLTNGEVCDAVWVQSEKVYSYCFCCILAHSAMEAPTTSGCRSNCVA